jgi:hypothetical protein
MRRGGWRRHERWTLVEVFCEFYGERKFLDGFVEQQNVGNKLKNKNDLSLTDDLDMTQMTGRIVDGRGSHSNDVVTFICCPAGMEKYPLRFKTIYYILVISGYCIFLFFLVEDIQSDQQENKSRVLPHLLFYRSVSLSLIVHVYLYLLHTVVLLVAYLSKNLLIIN